MRILYQDASPGAARALRAAVFGLCAFDTATLPIWSLAEISLLDVQPVAFTLWLPDAVRAWLFGADVLRGLAATTVLLCLLAASGWRHPVAAPLGAIAFGIHHIVLMSLSYVGHGTVALLLASWSLGLIAWADHRLERSGGSRPPGMSRHAPALITVMAILCVTYSLTGIHRVTYGGPDLYFTNAIEFWSVRNSNWETTSALLLGRLGWDVAEHPWLFAVGAWSFPLVTVAEACAPVALFSSRFRWFFLAVVVPFHFLSLVMMNIFFWRNLVLLIFLVDVDRFRRRPATRSGESHASPSARSSASPSRGGPDRDR